MTSLARHENKECQEEGGWPVLIRTLTETLAFKQWLSRADIVSHESI